jgi:hypothetical protein
LGVDPSASPRKRKRTLIASVAFLLVAAATGWALDYLSIGPFASAEREVQKENEAAELPFSVI